MKLLSIDTTAEICSIALLSGEQWFCFHEVRPREHAKILLPEIKRLLNSAELSVQELDLIVFGRGPGSFTGIRIAAGVAHGLSVSANCPLLPVSTLQSLAFSASLTGAESIWSAIDARMSEIYFAEFTLDAHGIPQALSEEQVLAPADINATPDDCAVFTGSGWMTEYPRPSVISEALETQYTGQLLPNAKDSAVLAMKLLQSGKAERVGPEEALPVYLRDKVTWDNKPKVGS